MSLAVEGVEGASSGRLTSTMEAGFSSVDKTGDVKGIVDSSVVVVALVVAIVVVVKRTSSSIVVIDVAVAVLDSRRRCVA